MKESTTIKISRGDADYLQRMKIRKGYVSLQFLVSKIVQAIKDHKLEGEIR